MTLKMGLRSRKPLIFPGRATAPGLGFDLFKASCLLLDGESWLLLVSAAEKQGGGVVGAGGVLGVLGRGGGHRHLLSKSEINHGAEAIIRNSSPARLVTCVT